MCLLYDALLENVFRAITHMTIISSTSFFHLKKRCEKLKEKPLNKDKGEGKRHSFGYCRVSADTSRGKSLILILPLSKLYNPGPCFELKLGKHLWWSAGCVLFKMETLNVGGGVMLSVVGKRSCETQFSKLKCSCETIVQNCILSI